MSQTLEVSISNFKITMTNMLKYLVGKSDKIHKQVISADTWKQLNETQMEMLKTKKNLYIRGYICSLDIKQLRKETVQLKLSQEKLFSLNHKEKKKKTESTTKGL